MCVFDGEEESEIQKKDDGSGQCVSDEHDYF